MKVESLIRTLFLLLILPSATVLSLSGSIDRIMKGGVVLLLLGTLHSVNSEIEKSTVHLCGIEMTCVTTETCTGGVDPMQITTFSNLPINGDCKVIMKIRSYSPEHKMYRVYLESRDPSVEKIIVNKKGTVLFSCEKGLQPKYKGADKKSINHTKDPLMCEFIAEDTEPIMNQSNDNIEFIADGEIVGQGKQIKIFADINDKFCKPSEIDFERGIEESGSDSFVEFIIGLTDLSCPSPYYIETKQKDASGQWESKYVKTTSINCVKISNDVYKYAIKRGDTEEFKTSFGRCALRSCTLCDKPEVEGLDLFEESDGCKKLKCKTGKLNGDSMGVATCKKNGDKSAWDLNGKIIEKDTQVTCDTKLECRSLVPFSCRDGETMILNSMNVTISCDYNTGNWIYSQDGATFFPIPDPAHFSCSSKDTKGSNVSDSKTSSASGTTIGCIVGGVLILIALIAGIAIYLNRRRNAQNNNIGKTTKSQEPFSIQPTSKSKESKKEPPSAGAGIPSPLVRVPEEPPVGKPSPIPPTPASALPQLTLERELGESEMKKLNEDVSLLTGDIPDASYGPETGTGTDVISKKGRVPNRNRETNRGVTPDTTKGTTTTTTKKEERRKHKLVKATGETETTGAWRDEIKEDFGKTGTMRDGLGPTQETTGNNK